MPSPSAVRRFVLKRVTAAQVVLSVPVLSMDPAWTSADNTPNFVIDIDGTIAAGDSITLQIQASGGSWISVVAESTHVITSGEDAANEIDLALGSLSNGDYEARCLVSRGSVASGWSNTVSFTIGIATGNYTAVYTSELQQ